MSDQQDFSHGVTFFRLLRRYSCPFGILIDNGVIAEPISDKGQRISLRIVGGGQEVHHALMVPHDPGGAGNGLIRVQ